MVIMSMSMCMDMQSEPQHHEIWKYCQSTSRVLQNLKVHRDKAPQDYTYQIEGQRQQP